MPCSRPGSRGGVRPGRPPEGLALPRPRAAAPSTASGGAAASSSKRSRTSPAERAVHPEAEAERAWLTEAILDALAELPPPYQSVIQMRFFHDMGYREIAECLQIPIGTVKSRLNYGLKGLRAHPPRAADLPRRPGALTHGGRSAPRPGGSRSDPLCYNGAENGARGDAPGGGPGWLTEDERRAAIFAAGELLDLDRVRALVGQPDLVICADGGLRHAQALGLRVDLLVGDSIPWTAPRWPTPVRPGWPSCRCR